MSPCGTKEPGDPQNINSGERRLFFRALLEDWERQEIKKDAKKYREIIKKTQEMLGKRV